MTDMTPRDRDEEQVRRLLGGPRSVVPADLAERAADHGRRILRRRRAVHTVLWLLLLAAVIAAAVLLTLWWPSPAPLETTP
ncbi:MAG: hypothetical protein QOI83_2233 [Streptomycetaceae bacterium]|jgi:ferric-dicitrate binding protein FerR (iron transport regulator)|nr:hypothetical protein [Streptomycetaceae bacterium]